MTGLLGLSQAQRSREGELLAPGALVYFVDTTGCWRVGRAYPGGTDRWFVATGSHGIHFKQGHALQTLPPAFLLGRDHATASLSTIETFISQASPDEGRSHTIATRLPYRASS